MNEVADKPQKRKILRVKTARTGFFHEPKVERPAASYMVWREGGDMPKKLYDNPELPCKHATRLARLYPHEKFHVLRSWRIFEGIEQ